MSLAVFLTSQMTGIIVVFARIGSILIFMPGFGETQVFVRYRLMFAVILSLALYPAIPVGPLQFNSWLQFIPIVALEITIGLWIGLTARIIMTALLFAGFQIGMVSGLTNVFAPKLGSFQGATLIASALLMLELTLIFATNLHHIIIRAILMSYEVFPPGQIMLGDMAGQIIKAVSKSFYIGLSLTAPFYVMGMLINSGLALANRMMPALPVFFVAGPILLGGGLFVLTVTGPHMAQGFEAAFTQWLTTLSF